MGAKVGKSGHSFLDALPSSNTLHVVMLGLDSAGKTTVLYRLKLDHYINTVPTIGFNCEKVQGTIGKAKGVNFLIWDVGGQEKLRPLWRSYTRCTDGILFVVDSVDVERIEEAKMELLRTAKCPDNQGVPVLILANKQDLPGAREPKELEKLLGLPELSCPLVSLKSMSCSSSSTGNIVGCSSTNCPNRAIRSHTAHNLTPTAQHSKSFESTNNLPLSSHTSSARHIYSSTSSIEYVSQEEYTKEYGTAASSSSSSCLRKHGSCKDIGSNQYVGWYIQPACAITGEGLQEGLEALHEMIVKRRKFNKANKRKR